MKDGYYLSTYLSPPGIERLVGVPLRHDQNLSLWRKSDHRVELLGHWELERLSGQKQHRTPFLSEQDLWDFVEPLLSAHGVARDDLVEIWGTPTLDTASDYHFVDDHPELACHAISHLFSAMLLDSERFFDDTILALAVDRGPDRVLDRRFKKFWYAGAVAHRGSVQLFPVSSPGPLYCEARNAFELREGTLMALASATRTRGECDRAAILRQFAFSGAEGMEEARRALRTIAEQVSESLQDLDERFDARTCRISAIMKEVQAICIAMMEANVERALAEHSLDPTQCHLGLVGGYALNCPTNSHLMRKYGFRQLLAPPCVNDCGQSIGIALGGFYRKLGGQRFSFRFPGPFLGGADSSLEATIEQHREHVASVRPATAEEVVRDLEREPIVWFHGRSEIGPRALGHRSLLADATQSASRDALNRIKKRQWWRPVAPIVLEEHLHEWFEDARPSAYMLETFRVLEARRSRIPAIVHEDGSARVQTLGADGDPELRAVLEALHRRTGVPLLCNTSLNDKGEPIIETHAQAFNFALRRGVTVGYFDGVRVEFRPDAGYREQIPLRRHCDPFVEISPEREQALRRAHNPYGLSDLELHVYLVHFELHEHDIRDAEGARAAKRAIEQLLARSDGLRESCERAMARNLEIFGSWGSSPRLPETAHTAA